MKKYLLLICLLPFISLSGHEGMWMPCNLNKETRQLMKELGVELPASMLYDANKPSMKDAIVNFGGFCSGVVVSDDGLVFTNHHCGFEAIQQHSSVENDYLLNGFVARSRQDELPNPDLFVSFLVQTKNVTTEILNGISPEMTEMERILTIDSISGLIQEDAAQRDSSLRYAVIPFSKGNEYYLEAYKDYHDVRLVYAPPSSIGKFGWDTDNWVWPRHTGDFAIFRIYAGADNEPAMYSENNTPFHPDYVVPVSLDGYQEGDFCMTMGYPGSTDRYLSSFGIEERMLTNNAAMINVRGIKQDIWSKAMQENDTIRLKYASKYAASSNYWKNSFGMNKAIKNLGVIEKKRELESELKRWIQQNPETRNKYIQVLTNLELNYRNRREASHAFAFFLETFLNAPELLSLAFSVMNFDFEGDSLSVVSNARKIYDMYNNLDIIVDKKVFVAVFDNYKRIVDGIYLPAIYHTIENDYGDNIQLFADSLYANSRMTHLNAFMNLLSRDTEFQLFDDPVIQLALDLLVKYYDLEAEMEKYSLAIEQNERLLNEGIREMESGLNYYPDANFTMRLSLGIISGYWPQNAVEYKYYTTINGIFEKAKTYHSDPDFRLQPELLDLLEKKDFGRYANSNGEMNVCFISNNDITGGNSGSGMFDAYGRLIGLAFDGNWEAMSGDFMFEKDYQRCIGVDIRYVLYIMERYGNANHIIEEMQLSKMAP